MSDKSDQEPAPEAPKLPQLARSDALNLWSQLARAQKDRDAAETANAIQILRLNQFPTPNETKEVISRRMAKDRQSILSNHGYWKEKRLKEGLEALMNAAAVALGDRCR